MLIHAIEILQLRKDITFTFIFNKYISTIGIRNCQHFVFLLSIPAT